MLDDVGWFRSQEELFFNAVSFRLILLPLSSPSLTRRNQGVIEKLPVRTGSHTRMTQLAHSETLYFVFGLNESASCLGLLALAAGSDASTCLLAPRSAATQTGWQSEEMRNEIGEK